MSNSPHSGVLAIDVGTSRVKFGWFPTGAACVAPPAASFLPITSPPLPEPVDMFACRHRGVPLRELDNHLAEWLTQFEALRPRVVLASVSPEGTEAVTQLLDQREFPSRQVLTHDDLPLNIDVKEPKRAGIDRLLNAVAVNRVRPAGQPAIVMDLGTAVTVDVVDGDGSFLGGTIFPGWSLAAAALHGGTSTLPLVTPDKLELPPQGLGKCTSEAISAGLYWGLIGALEKIAANHTAFLARKPHVYLTGGDAPLIASDLQVGLGAVRHLAHLVLAGIVLTCEAKR